MFSAAGIEGVVAGLVSDNGSVAGSLAAALRTAHATPANTDTAAKIQALVIKYGVDTINATPLSGSEDLYSAAGITGVTSGNLAKVNTAVLLEKARLARVLTAAEIQAAVNSL
jgi:hypothetical protein